MNTFFSSFFSEFGARRTRLRQALGNRGQSLFEFLVLSGLLLGSLGLYLKPWMASAAPWGFAIPFVFIAGYFALDAWRQAQLKEGTDADKTRKRCDLAALALTLICAGAGAAAFTIALRAAPAPVEESWQPPRGAVEIEIAPPLPPAP